MVSINAHLSKEEQFRIALACVRAYLPIPKKMYMGKECNDIAAELACASILLPAIGTLPARFRDNLKEHVGKSIEKGLDIVRTEEHDDIRLRGFEVSLAITNLAVLLLDQ